MKIYINKFIKYIYSGLNYNFKLILKNKSCKINKNILIYD